MSASSNASASRGSPQNHPNSNRKGLIPLLVGGFGTALLMMNDRQLWFGVPLGIVLMGVCVWGALDRLGCFDAPQVPNAPIVDASPTIGRGLIGLVSSMALLVVTVIAASKGVLPGHGAVAGFGITTTLLAAIISSYCIADAMGLLPARDGTLSLPKRLASHPSLWMLGLAVLLYVPFLGCYGLIDPWETHYGEVAREILARDDWMTLWWAQDGFFNSKPILDFWLQALAFASLGVDFHPDGFIGAASRGLWPQPEWAPRLPMILLTLIAHAVLYAGVKATWGRRAAFLGSVVWLTTPYWFIIAHQTMTDLPYIAPLAAAMGLFLLGFNEEPSRVVVTSRIRLKRRELYVSGASLVIGVLLLCCLPQILYLVSRNITLLTRRAPHGFNWHWDEFFAGSGGGNCGLPGNEACHAVAPVNMHPQPILSAVIWTLVLGVILMTKRRERRAQRLYFLGAWILIALSVLAKELPGLLIAVGALGAWIFIEKRWALLKQLELPSALLILLVVAVPWYVQETVRHGSPFLERLLIHDMYKRAFVHVHDTNAGEDVSFRYYVWQLGYGLFPASGLCAMAYLHWAFRRTVGERNTRATSSFLFLWSLAAFGMFALTLTKFHHYIIPMVPPVAMLTGPLLNHALWRVKWPQNKHLVLYIALVIASAVALIFGVASYVPVGKAEVPPHALRGAILLLLAAGLLTWGYLQLPRSGRSLPPLRVAVVLKLLGVGALLTTFLVGCDLFRSVPGDVVGPMRLIHLVCYNYARPWPDTLHFEPIVAGFTVASVVGLLGWVVGGKARVHGLVVFGTVACLWTGWALDRYLVQIAPHWSQRETVLEYYKRRKSPEEWLVAYQMNWKGENIYTGNHLITFVSTGEKFKSWVDERRKSNHPVIFVTTEHTRVSSLKSEIGKTRAFEVLTDKALNNKFTLVRAEL